MFSRVAAASLLKELGELQVEGCEDISVCTLHSFCFRALTRQEIFDFSGRVPRPLVTFVNVGVLRFEGGPLLQDITMDGKRKDTKRVRAFEAARARLQSDEPGWPLDADDRVFHDNLLQWLIFHRAMLIGELVPEVLNTCETIRQAPSFPLLIM